MAANVEGSIWSRIDYDDEAIRLMVHVTYIKLLILESEGSYKPLTLLLLRLNLHSCSFVHVLSVKINFQLKLNLFMVSQFAFVVQKQGKDINCHQDMTSGLLPSLKFSPLPPKR